MAKFSNSIYLPDLVGSIGGITIQQNASGNVLRIKPKRAKENSNRQDIQLSIFSYLSTSWRQLTRAEQLLWDAFALANPHVDLWGNTKQITGFAYFVMCNYNLQQSGNATITTPPSYTVPTLAASVAVTISSTDIIVELVTPSANVGDTIAIFLTAPLIAKNFLPRKELRLMKYITYAGVDTFNLTNEWEIYFNLPVNDALYSPSNQIYIAATIFDSSSGIAAPYIINESILGPSNFDTLSLLIDASNQAARYTGGLMPPNIDTTSPFSLNFWLRLNQNAVQLPVYFFGKNSFAVEDLICTYVDSSNCLELVIRKNGSDVIDVIANSNPLTVGQWYNVAITYDGSRDANNVLIYLDGISVPVTIIDNTLSNNLDTPDFIGCGTNLAYISGNPSDCNIDELSYWNIELSALEITEIYNGGTPLDLSGLSFFANANNWWRMGEGATYPDIPDEIGFFTLSMVNMAPSNIVSDVP